MKARHKDTGEIIELAEEGIISCDGRRFCWYQVELIPEPIDDFKPSIPSDLDEAAEEWCKTNHKGIALSADKKSHYLAEGKDAFKAGAEWMAGQGETIDGEITTTSDNGWETIRIPKKLYQLGTKVTVQIRKKQ